MKKPVGDMRSQGRPAQSDLTEVQAKLLSALNHEAVDIIFARYSAARVLGLWSIWEQIGEQEVIWRPPGWPHETSPEHERRLRSLTSLELKFDTEVLRDLRSGELLAFGIRLPFKPSSRPEPIPQGLWYLMAFDMEKRTAEGGPWSFKELRTIAVRSMRPSDRHEVDVALGIIARRLEAEAAGHDEPAAVPKEPAGAPLGAAPSNPLYVSLAGAGDHVVVKTETLRRNTRHGKVPDRELEGPEPPNGAAEAPAPDPEEPPKPKKKRGPKTLNPEIEAYLRERAAKKICDAAWLEESIHLHSWAKNKYAKEIRSGSRVLAKLKWLREKHADLYYQLNPEFDRRQQFQQESG